MTPTDVKQLYKSGYVFNKQTKMSACSFHNWLKWGYVPEGSQLKLEKLTQGKLKADGDYPQNN